MKNWSRLAWLAVVVSVIGLVSTALYGPPQEWARERLIEQTVAEKLASVATLKANDPSSEELLGTVWQKTELLFGDCDAVIIEETEDGITMLPRKESGDCRAIAATVPVTSDGYFLTAAHALLGSSQVIVAMTKDGDRLRARSASARVVWIPAERGVHPDLAVLHADVGPVDSFEMAEPPSAEDVVVLTGSGGSRGTAVGQVLGVRTIMAGQSGSIYQLVRHDVPSMRGDSGGALADLHGRLIGINTDVHPPSWLAWLPSIGSRISYLMGGVGSYSQAVRPDPDWLADLIAADRERLAAE